MNTIDKVLHIDTHWLSIVIIVSISCFLCIVLALIIRETRKTSLMYRVLIGNVQKQGAWGEKILYNTLNACGLRSGIDYSSQPQYSIEGKIHIPDCVMNLASDKKLIIDSKVCMVSSHNNDRKSHARNIKKQIIKLAEKDYPAKVPNSAETCLMFLPTDAMLAQALTVDFRLINEALERNIAIVTPSTLMLSVKLLEQYSCQGALSKRYEEARTRYKQVTAHSKNLVSHLQKLEIESRKVQLILKETKGL